MSLPNRLPSAFKAGGVHLILSLFVAALAAALVFGLWYPYPYNELMGGGELFALVIAVDVVCGPLLTMVLYNPAKPRAELVRDLGLVALIQFAALAYGLHTVMVVRPVYLVFELDRYNAVSAIDVDEEALSRVKAPWNELPLWGPKVIGVRGPKDGAEKLKSLDLSLQGNEPSARPDWWQSLELSRPDVLKRAKPVSDLRKRHQGKPESMARIEAAIKDSGKPEDMIQWLPMTSRRTKEWIVIIDGQTALPVAYAAVDGF